LTTLTLVGVLYCVSGVWCLLNPVLAGSYVGYGMSSSLASAEFFTVYGGLQLGLGLGMVIASRSALYMAGGLVMALVVSWALLFARLASGVVYPEVFSNPNSLGMTVLELVLAVALGIAFLRGLRTG
jgi:hypothetical protein